MNDRLTKKLDELLHWLEKWRSALVAFSGGVDSALIMAAAQQQLSENMLACIGVSPSYPARERELAVRLAEQRGAAYRLVHTQELDDENYAANPQNRCYFCKSQLYAHLRQIADTEGWHVILDGTNASDLGDDRPGRIAASEHGIRSPLVELRLSKSDVRQLAKHLGLAVWNKPAMACLSSRVPHGTPITPQLLHQIETAEDVLVAAGFEQFRVRHHGDLARIELESDDLMRAIEQRATLVEQIKRTGYRHVCLDLAGFRGSSPSAGVPTVPLTVEGER